MAKKFSWSDVKDIYLNDEGIKRMYNKAVSENGVTATLEEVVEEYVCLTEALPDVEPQEKVNPLDYEDFASTLANYKN